MYKSMYFTDSNIKSAELMIWPACQKRDAAVDNVSSLEHCVHSPNTTAVPQDSLASDSHKRTLQWKWDEALTDGYLLTFISLPVKHLALSFLNVPLSLGPLIWHATVPTGLSFPTSLGMFTIHLSLCLNTDSVECHPDVLSPLESLCTK